MDNRREYRGAPHYEFHNPIFNDGQQFTGSQTRDDGRLAGLRQQPTISRFWFWFLWLSRSKKRKDELSISECLRSLHFQDYQARRLNISERDPCTFEWIWKHPAFVKWENSPSSSLLWLQGKPASGKSTLMKYIRMDLDNRLSDSDTENASGRIVIDFFYSDRGGDAQRGHEWMLRSLLYQLLSTRHDMWNCYRSKFKEFKQLGHQHWQLESLKDTFSIIKTSCYLPLTIYVLIDAMDESDQQKREDILELLSSVCDSEGSLVLRILAASRPVPKIASVLNKYITITLEEEITADIVRFTSKRMDRISEILGVNSTEVQEIHGMIVERSRGVFLWVKLVLDELENMVHDGSTISHMKSVLETLPQDLDAFYAHMLESRLPKIGTTMHTETLRMLQWVAYSSRPLSLLELTEAVAVARSDSRDISLHWLKEGRALTLDQANRMLLTRCGGFLEVKNGIVQFIHQTVRDFLFNLPATSSLHILEHESIESVATTCLRYLKFINGRIAQKREGWQRAGGESEDPNVHSEIIDFLKSSQLALLNYAVYASQPMNRSDNPVFGNLESARQEFIPLIRKLFQRAIHFDRIDDIDLLLQNRVEIDREDTDAIRSFFESKSIDHYCFPACEGYFNVVDWLVSDCGWSVGRGLQQAFSKGHEAGIQCLLKYGVPDKDMLEELSKAAMKDQWGLVELLLKHGFKEGDMYKASYNALRNKFAGNGSRMMRILHHAASKGYGAIVGLLLKNGEDDNSKDDDGQIALHFAADGGHKEIVQQLLDHSADKKAKTNNGSTALHLASAGGHDSIIQLLIQHFGADWETKTNNGSTALHLASAGGHDSIIQLLIQHFGADREAKTNNGSTALHFASAGGHDSTVQLLIQHFGTNKNAKTNDGSTALHLASAAGHDSTIQLIIQKFGADRKAKNNAGQTALHLLLENIIDVRIIRRSDGSSGIIIDDMRIDGIRRMRRILHHGERYYDVLLLFESEWDLLTKTQIVGKIDGINPGSRYSTRNFARSGSSVGVRF